jgi:hypothetical protein
LGDDPVDTPTPTRRRLPTATIAADFTNGFDVAVVGDGALAWKRGVVGFDHAVGDPPRAAAARPCHLRRPFAAAANPTRI